MKAQKKILFLSLILTAILGAGRIAAQSQILADPSDLFQVSAPLANRTVTGNVTTTWKVFDNNQPSIPYELTLRDSRTCDAKFATISAGSVTSSATADAKVTWPSAGPLADVSSVPDGNYCMQLCVSLKNGDQSYSACNLRVITVRNTNIPPKITSNPPANRTISVGDSWQYAVKATDANGDSLTYRLVNSPSFLSIDSVTGLISTNSTTKTPGTYNVTVTVQDSFGGSDSQTFQLIVTAPVVTPVGNQPATIVITFPVSGAILKGVSNKLAWQASDPDGIKSISLLYSTDKVTWIPIASVGPDIKSYVWDVSNITDGSYFLQVIVNDSQDKATMVVSDEFNIRNKSDTFPPVTSKPLIVNVKPEDGSVITTQRPDVTGEFTPPINATISAQSFKLMVDDQDKTSICTVDEKGFKCTPDQDFTLGTHKLTASVNSSDGQTATRDWTFTINSAANVVPVSSGSTQQISPQVLVIGLIVCVLALILFLVPWLLYTLWRRRSQEQQDGTTTVTTTYTPGGSPVSPNPSDYGSYEDYLAAVGSTPTVTTNYYTPADSAAPSAPTSISDYSGYTSPMDSAPAIDPNTYVAPTDYLGYLQPQGGPQPVTSSQDTPSWLSSPGLEQTTSYAPAEPITPAPAAIPVPATTVAMDQSQPLAPVETPVEAAGAQKTADIGAPLAPAASQFEPIEPTEILPPPVNGSDNGGYGYGRQVDNF